MFPLLLAPMIHAIGLPWTFRALSIALFGLITPSLRFMKGRLPDSSVCGIASQNSNTAWMKNPSVWLLMAANTVQGFAYFIPIIWLPSTLHVHHPCWIADHFSFCLCFGSSGYSKISDCGIIKRLAFRIEVSGLSNLISSRCFCFWRPCDWFLIRQSQPVDTGRVHSSIICIGDLRIMGNPFE